MFRADLNCDLGESFGNYTIGNDEEILDYVTSVNIACGFHAGDPVVMEKTVRLAIEKGASIGAHPGYPDLMGFGRRSMNVSMEEARAYMIYQIGALKAFVEGYGGRLQHVKPHGALYNTAATDYSLAKTLAQAVYDVDRDLIFMGLANSEMIRAARDIGLKVSNEVFADRAYNNNGTLVSRKLKGAVIHDTEVCVGRVKDMVKRGIVKSIDGSEIEIKADSICVHGDNVMALEFVKNLREKLTNDGVEFKPLKDLSYLD